MGEREDLSPELRAAMEEMNLPRDAPPGGHMNAFLGQQRRSNNIEDRRQSQGSQAAARRQQAIEETVNRTAGDELMRRMLEMARNSNIDPTEIEQYMRDMGPRSRGIDPDNDDPELQY